MKHRKPRTLIGRPATWHRNCSICEAKKEGIVLGEIKALRRTMKKLKALYRNVGGFDMRGSLIYQWCREAARHRVEWGR